MKRNRLALVVALLVVVALGLATATLANPTTSGAGGAGGGAGGATGPGTDASNGTDAGPAQNQSGSPLPTLGSAFTVCVPFLLTPTFLGLAALAFVAFFLVVRWRANTAIALALLLVLTFPTLILHALLTKCGTASNPVQAAVNEVTNQTSSVGGSPGTNPVETVTTPPVLLLALVAVLAVLLYLFVRGSGDDEDAPEVREPDPEDSLGAVAAAAGTAADRIESDADVENAVYRAWRDMTGHLDTASPETTTPAEFARAARDAGMDARHVDTLTDVFREVRYGDEPVTEERERRALDALRDIEAAYGGDEE
ncbi:DUF4129 domain-containing protein [Salarchaeum japonicum]|uniref:Protein-glutamine gamma-glutamyltransferase-like C-terminal domain-containing protein n=1 Tax=Salarchaeum japonicum TaxID=555573 RepID=A0AAV3T0D7_9EURY|nr:DUF4129 domain-containing protein [Salarchaeum japonicum]